jgi:hypothetical protein
MRIFLLCFLLVINLKAQPYYTFSELKGIEDYEENTQLFYRLYNFQTYNIWSNSIYRLDINSNIDSFYLPDYSYYNPPIGGYSIKTHNFSLWNNNPYEYIFCTTSDFFGSAENAASPATIIERFDGGNYQNISGYANVGISEQNDSLIYGVNGVFVKSTDGGWNWTEMPLQDFSFLSVSPFNDQVIFGLGSGGKLLKSIDGGETAFVADTNFSRIYDNSYYNANQFEYDNNSFHIYRVYQNTNQYFLSVSDNNGEPFSWSIRYNSSNKIFISVDYGQSGKIYLADGRRIYVSDDYGSGFNEYKVLDRRIVGIYKKPNSDKLYAATKYNLYEITPDTIVVLKNLPIGPDEFAWFPLNIGDKWIYDNVWYGDPGDSARWVSASEVIEYITIEDKMYAKIFVRNFGPNFLNQPGSSYQYFRVDSVSGLIYRAEINNDTITHEELYMDLLAEAGDTILVGNGIYLDSEFPFTQFGVNSKKRIFLHVLTPAQQIELVNGFGLVYEFWWELTELRRTLKGCIIDGIVYGDTTVLSVITDNEDIPKAFSLAQNYPNPFNPSTSIEYRVGSIEYITLKVYDILGREVTTLVNEEQQPGVYEVEFSPASGNRDLASGIYYYQLKAGSYIQTKKMIYLK